MDNPQIQKIKRDKVIAATVVVGLVFVVLIFLFFYSKYELIKIDDLSAPIVRGQDPFATLEVTARSAAVYDVRHNKFIFIKNSQDVLPLASITKLMTALAATEILPKDSTVSIGDTFLGDDKEQTLRPNEKWNAQKLIDFTLVSSSNAGAQAIASASGAYLAHGQPTDTQKSQENFVEYMNTRAKTLDLNSLQFYNDSGLDLSPNQGGAYGNVEDVSRLASYILQNTPELFESTKYPRLALASASNFIHDVKNTNTIVESIPGILGSKTGYTDLAQGNLVVTFSPGLEGPYVAVVLGSTFDGRFEDINKLVKATVESINP